MNNGTVFRYASVVMGRTRSLVAHERALAAAADLVGERGVEALTVDEVAIRSGVAKTTIYRHWPTRQGLALDALRTLAGAVPTPNTGDLRRDLRLCLAELVEKASDQGLRRKMIAVLQAADQNTEFARIHRALIEERMRPVRTVLQLAQARGEVPSDLDLDIAIDLLHGPVIMRLLMRRGQVDAAMVDTVIDVVAAGLHARASPPLESDPPPVF